MHIHIGDMEMGDEMSDFFVMWEERGGRIKRDDLLIKEVILHRSVYWSQNTAYRRCSRRKRRRGWRRGVQERRRMWRGDDDGGIDREGGGSVTKESL